MDKRKVKDRRRKRRRTGIRKRIEGTPERPRLCVYKSLKHFYAQVVDDMSGRTIVSASSRDKSISTDATGNVGAAEAVGKALAEKARSAGVQTVAFDRSGFRYHGRVKAFADAAREGGLNF